jgi:hypothetical protein
MTHTRFSTVNVTITVVVLLLLVSRQSSWTQSFVTTNNLNFPSKFIGDSSSISIRRRRRYNNNNNYCYNMRTSQNSHNNNNNIHNYDRDPECTQQQQQQSITMLYQSQAQQRESIRYQIIAAEACESLATRMAQKYPQRFTYHPTQWLKFPDGTDNIEIGGFTPINILSGEHVLFLASFHNNDVTLSQFQVMICLLQSFIESMTVVLPFSPVGTMERVIREGQVATAATYAHSTYNN